MNTISCPMSLAFSSSGAGWAEAKLRIGKDAFDFSISYLWAGINELLDRVYYLYPNWGHDDADWNIMEYGEADLPTVFDGKEMIIHWEEIPWKTSLDWDGEGESVRWDFERPVNLDDDFDVVITLAAYKNEERKYKYSIRYKDLCYAVSKAITDFIAEYGIIGYHESTWMKDINLRHFLKIKGIALDEAITENAGYEERWKVTSSLEAEIKLLLKPM